jgi:hypothetical protein
VRSSRVGQGGGYLKASACCKALIGYSLERWGGTDRHHFNAVITDQARVSARRRAALTTDRSHRAVAQDLVDTYLPAFQARSQRACCLRSLIVVRALARCMHETANAFPTQACITEGKATGVMCSYNAVRATHANANANSRAVARRSTAFLRARRSGSTPQFCVNSGALTATSRQVRTDGRGACGRT